MPLAFIQAHPHDIPADALVQAESAAFPGFHICFGTPSPSWPTLSSSTSPEPVHPLFSGQKFPENPWKHLECYPEGAAVWELNPLPQKKHLLLLHTMLPQASSDWKAEWLTLAACYRNTLRLAAALGCTSVVFPLLSASLADFPPEKAFILAALTLGQLLTELEENLMVFLTIPGSDSLDIHMDPALAIRIGTYVQHINPALSSGRYASGMYQPDGLPSDLLYFPQQVRETPFDDQLYRVQSLEPDALKRLQKTLQQEPSETFHQMLFRLIEKKRLEHKQVYKRANLDRRLFSKIRKNPEYLPNKNTVLALAIALQLNLTETRQLLETAGFTLSHTLRRDIIVEFFIQEGRYNIFEINEVLFCFSLPLLGLTEGLWQPDPLL